MTILTKQPAGYYTFMHDGMEIIHPALSPRAAPTEFSSGQISPEEYGFEVISTGGGCTAWSKDFELEDGRKVYMLLTQDLSHELDVTAPVECGVYELTEYDDGNCMAFWTIDQDYDVVVDTKDWPEWEQPE